jgi:hypothetical protein
VSQALEKWLNDGLEAQVAEDERQRKADEARAAVAVEKEREAFEAFGKQLAGFAGPDEPDEPDGAA